MNEGAKAYPWRPPVSVIGCVLIIIKNNNIYGLEVGIWMVSEILGLL